MNTKFLVVDNNGNYDGKLFPSPTENLNGMEWTYCANKYIQSAFGSRQQAKKMVEKLERNLKLSRLSELKWNIIEVTEDDLKCVENLGKIYMEFIHRKCN